MQANIYQRKNKNEKKIVKRCENNFFSIFLFLLLIFCLYILKYVYSKKTVVLYNLCLHFTYIIYKKTMYMMVSTLFLIICYVRVQYTST